MAESKFTTVDKAPKPQDEDWGSVIERNRYKRPIPGQSLTQDPERPLPFERPPEFTNLERAQEWMFDKITSQGPELVDLIAKGVPLEDLVTMMLTTGFQAGKWNVDLMLLLIEPTFYTLIFVAEVAGIDYVLSDDEEALIDADTQMRAESKLASYIAKSAGSIEQEVQESGEQAVINKLPESLLARAQV